MGRLIYSGLISLDGYLNDADGRFDWAMPDEEVHEAVNDLARPITTWLLGRRMFEVMSYWEGVDVTGEPPAIVDFANIWAATDKVVFSRTLPAIGTARTTLQREFDPEAVRAFKADGGDLSVGGAGFAARAIHAGLVDELQIFTSPVMVGGGTRFLPDGGRLDLTLLEERRFGNGVVLTRYGVS